MTTNKMVPDIQHLFVYEKMWYLRRRIEVMVEKNIIQSKCIEFALEVISLSKVLSRRKEFVLSTQLLRSGTAIGALIEEAQHAESKKDFIHKCAIAQKEANETRYWLLLLYRSKYIDGKVHTKLNQECTSIIRLLARIILTARNNLS